jgi:hypothetical protein
MDLPLVVVPDLSPCDGKDRADTQQIPHSGGLEDAALRIDEGNSLAFDDKASTEIVGCNHVGNADTLQLLDGSEPNARVGIHRIHTSS